MLHKERGYLQPGFYIAQVLSFPGHKQLTTDYCISPIHVVLSAFFSAKDLLKAAMLSKF
jgi:hypothetical protein